MCEPWKCGARWKEAKCKGPYIIGFHSYETSRIYKYIETESGLATDFGLAGEKGCGKGKGGGKRGGMSTVYGVLWGDKNAPKLTLVMAAQTGGYTINHWIVHFKWVNCTELNLHKLVVKKKKRIGTSLAVQWLRFHLLTQGVWVQFLIRELRSHIPPGQKPKT